MWLFTDFITQKSKCFDIDTKNSGGSRISQTGGSNWSRNINLLFDQKFPKNCIKKKQKTKKTPKNGPGGGGHVPASSKFANENFTKQTFKNAFKQLIFMFCLKC